MNGIRSKRKLRSEYGLPANVNAILQLLPSKPTSWMFCERVFQLLASYDVELEDRSREANTT